MESVLTLPTTEQLLSVAEEAAGQASDICLRYFRNPLNIDFKGDDSPVTVADRETEQKLRDVITSHFPNHGIFGEEHGQHGLDEDVVWVLDPIDGTKSFISGNPMFGMLISVLVKRDLNLGIIHMPAIGETFLGQKGKPSTHNGREIRTRECKDLKDAVCFIGEADKLFSARPDIYPKLEESTRLARFGYDCYSYGQLAGGHIDMVIERGLHPYDFCAVIPVIEGAGGVVTDWQGNPMTLESNGDILACGSRELHNQALDLINS